MIKKSAVLVGNDEFWHSAIVDDSCDTSSDSSNDSCEEQLAPAGLPAAHHQLLSSDVPSYDCLTGYDHRREDTSASLFFDEDDDTFSLDEDEEDSRMTTSSCCRQEKMSSVKKIGGGSWLLGFARLQSRSVDEDDSDNEEDEKAQASSSKLSPLEQEEDGLPGLVRTDSASDFSFSTTSCTEDDNSTTTSTSSNSDNDSLSPKKKSVGFNSTVKIQPIPHASTYSPMQRRKMYSSSLEVRKNKIRNKKEYRFDGYDWRNVTEEWEMSVDMVTGELVHPVHNHML
mmetsp:Transcript_2340/g.3282  ORF Transcript_2340/g.3282 Transcript_2340/m.3282 type:complete len:284 (-) Transcript_2340:147-998(-)